ncbi:MAG: SPFH domain-containing protein [Leptospiraceae bacterium]|nr:SPFH domain-containing protein [Leptospiraceae bacterium]
MLGIRFLKVRPTDYAILFRKGKIKTEGAGISFFYYSPSSSVVIVPAASCDSPFIFKETTVDFQEINIQGQFTYRVLEPTKLAGLLDFVVDANGEYTGDGLEKLPVRLTNVIQVILREKLSSLDLRAALKSGSEFVTHVKSRIQKNETLVSLGIELTDFAILKISPTPEISRALEASARESLLKEADAAIYVRRNFAVDEERKIKENELQTQIAIEEKNKKIREEQMNIEIAVQEKQSHLEKAKMETKKSILEKENELGAIKLKALIKQEEEKKQLVAFESENKLQLAKVTGEALKLELSALKELSPELLEVLATNQMSSNQIVSKAMKDLAKNAGKIGNLNISPELLTGLLEQKK